MSGRNGCIGVGVNGSSGGGGGGAGDSSLITGVVETVDAASVAIPLASLLPIGSLVLLRAVQVSAMVIAPVLGTAGQIMSAPSGQAQTSAADGTVVFGSVTYSGPTLDLTATSSTGYSGGPAFASPGALPCTITAPASILTLTVTGLLTITVRWRYVMNLYPFDGAIRLHP